MIKKPKKIGSKKKEREEEWKETRERKGEREKKKIGRNNEDTDLHPIRLCPFFRWRN